ncbi:unnamed protein product [Acanthoscelides obtectus]|uniref:Uncharacterized protein n=1 Tax=Acanthoscelides obtectus TaxID=200917 RepID=A0A9P0PF08_ACAOB|nr:unnamed protein product [Acanthoscelides obtectus]CAK1669260.1 hypothetical protein AOBTE_LOCUS26905 [Acanthoscelides obtectus]
MAKTNTRSSWSGIGRPCIRRYSSRSRWSSGHLCRRRGHKGCSDMRNLIGQWAVPRVSEEWRGVAAGKMEED